jgi:CRISPR-associated protein Cas1
MKPVKRIELPRIEDRISFVYADNCRLEKSNGAIRLITNDGSMDIPAAQLVVLMLGPGTTVTHRMVQIASEAGMCIIWVGEEGVRFYAGGLPLSGDTKLLVNQARIVSNEKLRIAAAKRMYNIRYPDEDIAELSMRQLLGREGTKVGRRYQELSEAYKVPWNGRKYNSDDFSKNDPLQNALSCANSCLYGLCYSAVYSLGLSPGLGIIHTGLSKSFVLDVADLYKETVSFPAAFSVIADGSYDMERRVRYKMRDLFKDRRFLKCIVSDIMTTLDDNDEKTIDGRNRLWAGFKENVDGAVRYGKK